jgi:carboxymethylenebutenolidase
MGKIIKRVLIGLLIVLVGGVVVLGGIIAVEGAQGPGRLAQITNITIAGKGGPDVSAYVARPKGSGPHPAVIMIHEFWGINNEIAGKAQALANEGYVVIAPDLFRGSTTNMVPRAIFQVATNPVGQQKEDLDAVYAWLSAQPDVKADRIGIMGFCFGGGASIRYSLSNNKLAATAVFYGSPIVDPAQLKALPGPVLGIFGGADFSIPQEEVRAFEEGLKTAGIPHEITVYDGQPHAFVTSVEGIRSGSAQGQAWAQLLAFFKQSLQASESKPHAQVTAVDAAGESLAYLVRLALSHIGTSHAH